MQAISLPTPKGSGLSLLTWKPVQEQASTRDSGRLQMLPKVEIRLTKFSNAKATMQLQLLQLKTQSALQCSKHWWQVWLAMLAVLLSPPSDCTPLYSESTWLMKLNYWAPAFGRSCFWVCCWSAHTSQIFNCNNCTMRQWHHEQPALQLYDCKFGIFSRPTTRSNAHTTSLANRFCALRRLTLEKLLP